MFVCVTERTQMGAELVCGCVSVCDRPQRDAE